MDALREEYEAMQRDLLDLADIIHNQHKGGVEFGVGHRLHPAEIHTIEAVGDEPEITVTNLAKRMKVSKPTISERINKLVKNGLVAKGGRPDDAKAVTLHLTETGWIAYEHHAAHHQKMFDFFLRRYGDDAEDVTRKMSFAFREMRNLALLSDCREAHS